MGAAPLDENRQIGLRELRQRASEVIRDVEARGGCLVTVSGRPAATLSPWTVPERISVAQFDGLLAATPNTDTRHYELIGGSLVVSPSPDFAHQRISRELLIALHEAASSAGDVEAVATWSWRIDEFNCPEPDLMVVPTAQASGARLVGTPSLVVEVTSTNRAEDLHRKRELYASAGAPSYWVLDRRRRMMLVYSLDRAEMSYPDPTVHHDGSVEIPTSFGSVALDLTTLWGAGSTPV